MPAFAAAFDAHHDDVPVEEVESALVIADELGLVVTFAGQPFLFNLFVDLPLQEIMGGVILFGEGDVYQLIDALADLDLMAEEEFCHSFETGLDIGTAGHGQVSVGGLRFHLDLSVKGFLHLFGWHKLDLLGGRSRPDSGPGAAPER